MNIGKSNYPEVISINSEMIKCTKEIKYLGIMIDANLKWNNHIELLNTKIDKCMRVFNLMNFMNKEIDLKYKKLLYHQIVVPVISYGCKTWHKELKFKYQKERIKRMQRRSIVSLFRPYRTSNNQKLLNILGILEINSNLKIITDEKRDEYLEKLKEQGYTEDNRILEQIKYKETLWFLLGHGPFKEYLFRFNLTENPYCRFCDKEDNIESAEHLIFECERFRTDNLLINDLLELEERVQEIVREINKTDQRLI